MKWVNWRRAGPLLIGLVAAGLVWILMGCSYSLYDGKYRGALGCINATGPGFTITCPDKMQTVPIPSETAPK